MEWSGGGRRRFYLIPKNERAAERRTRSEIVAGACVYNDYFFFSVYILCEDIL